MLRCKSARHAEQFGGAGLVAAAALERVEDSIALE
jgi:hypothetical protein